MTLIGLNQFTEEEKTDYQQRMRRVVEQISTYQKENPAFYNEGEQFKTALGELNLFFSQGKATWFDQYRGIISNYFLNARFTGVRKAIIEEFSSCWTELPLNDRIMVSRMNEQLYQVANIFQQAPGRLFQAINEDFKREVRMLYQNDLLLEDLTNGHENSVIYYMRKIGDDPIFKVIVNEVVISIQILKPEDHDEIHTTGQYLLKIIVEQVNFRN